MIDLTFSKEWDDEQGYHAGGVSQAPGVLITWQRGPLIDGGGRNGAFVIEVLQALYSFVEYQSFDCGIQQGFGFVFFDGYNADQPECRASVSASVAKLVVKHLSHFQASKFACQENLDAIAALEYFVAEIASIPPEDTLRFQVLDQSTRCLEYLEKAIAPLVARRDRRKAEGTLGTNKV